ncbi:MAG TPA: hypothetical protein VLA33_03920 [Gemmatimonadota bacterium]|nr:hypothetical protein [Gemmatimonadota bacterium]
MHAQLELLMELQDLRAQSRSLAEESTRQVEEDVFELTPDEARATLDAKIDELAEELDPPVRARYRTLTGSMERVVVPVLNGVCYGCFVAAPTAWTSRAGPNEQITTCSHCGRFLYYVD